MSLGKITQSDFSAGMWQGVARHLIPNNGAYDIDNGLLDDDGSVYGRGGSNYRSTALASSTGGLMTVWDGRLFAGYRTVIGSAGSLGVLDSDESTAVTLDTPLSGFTSAQTVPVKPVSMLGYLLFPYFDTTGTGSGSGVMVYAGSRKPSRTDTVTFTNGSAVVTGSGTSWLSNLDKGMRVSATKLIQSVDSNTQFTMNSTWTNATTTTSNTMVPVYFELPFGPFEFSSNLTVIAVVPCGGQPRLILCSSKRAYFSTAGTFSSSAGAWNVNNYHEIPGGAEIIGAEAIRDTLLLFTTNGVWAIYNMALDLVDDFGNVQHRQEHIAKDVVLWGNTGVATLGQRVVLPCLDGVYLLDGISSPKLISQPINTRYRGYVKAGHKPGVGTVFRGHYFLPILTSGNVWVDTLVCRVDRPIQGPGGVNVFPWSRLSGYGAKNRAYTPLYRATGTTSGLMGASSEVGRVLNANYLEPSAANKTDADATVPVPSIISKDWPTGTNNPNTVRRLRVRHETVDAASDDPTWSAFVTADSSSSEQALSGSAPEDDGRLPFTWPVNKRTRFLRWRLQAANAAQSRVIRSVEMFVRSSRRP